MAGTAYEWTFTPLDNGEVQAIGIRADGARIARRFANMIDARELCLDDARREEADRFNNAVDNWRNVGVHR